MHRRASHLQDRGAIGVLDIGTTKVCCVIAAPDASGRMGLLGLGHQRSRGIKAGVIVDAGEAELAVRSALAQAERMAGMTLDRVIVGVSCGRISANRFTARARVERGIVTDDEIARLVSGAEAYVSKSGRAAIHIEHADWSLDGVGGVGDPRGLAARELATQVTAISADDAPVRNLLAVIERCHIEVERLMPTPLASAIAVTTPEERAGTVLVVDIGGGTISLCAIVDGTPALVEAVPVGSNHITYDIARALATSVAEAERIKTLYGTLVKAASDNSEFVSYPVESAEGPAMYQTSKAQLRSNIAPRVDSLFALILERLAASGAGHLTAGRVLLTGGGSQLLGLDQAWMLRFGGDARVARPRPLLGMQAGMCGPALSAVLGLQWSQQELAAGGHALRSSPSRRRGYLGRMQRWLGDGF